MDGFSDQPFRSLCRQFGSAISYTEFINSTDVIQANPYIAKRIAFESSERPVGFQIYGHKKNEICQAADLLINHHPDFFDLNLGCSEKHVAARGAGSGLLKHPEKIGEIVSELVSLTDLPVTAKIRIGWEKRSFNYLEVSRILEASGASLIAVHGRTRDQRWREPAFWHPIKEIKTEVSIPVIGNGDVKNLDDIIRMKKETGCDGIMIGRAAIGNPWIFSRIDKNELSQPEIVDIVAKHWKSEREFYGREKALVLFRKHLKAYLMSHQFRNLDLKLLISSSDPIIALGIEN